jgi:tetratricopeptide (TPR) repeat protein
VKQVIARRLEKLPSASRTLLKAAAVLGDRFDFRLISRLSSGDQIETLKTIQDLISRRFLEEDRDAYRFTHNLVRRVALGELDDREKEQWHRAALDALIALHPEAVEALAYHAMAGKRWREAVIYNRQAGDRARAMYAGDRAVIFYTRALEAQRSLGVKPGEIDFELLQHRGEVFQETGRFAEAENDFRTIIRLASQIGDRAAQAAANNALSYLHFQRGSYDQALALSVETYEMARQLNSDALMARALLNSANALRNLGRSSESIPYYQQAATLFESLGDDIRLADCLTRMGYAHLFNGHLSQAEEAMVRGMTMRRRLDERVGLAYSLINLTGLYLFKGALASASQTAAEAYEIALATGDPYGQDAALAVLGNVSAEQGAFDQALDYLERALIIGRKIGDRPLIAELLAEMGRIHSYVGNAETAHDLLLDALSCQKDGGEIWHYGAILGYLAEWELRFGEAESAWDNARTALSAAQQLRAPYHLAEAHRIAGMTLAKIKDESLSETPETHFEASLRWLEGRGFHPSLAHTLAAYGRYLLQGGDEENHARGAAMLNDARAIYRELGMDWKLDRLDEESQDAYKQIIVRLPRAEAPAGRPLKADEWVAVRWRIAVRSDDDFWNKGERRRHRLLRLLREADAQNAAPRVHDLARALGVSPKTIKRDLAALRSQGAVVHTRGSRG